MNRRLMLAAAGAAVLGGLALPALAAPAAGVATHEVCVDTNNGTQGWCVTWNDPNTGVGIPPIG